MRPVREVTAEEENFRTEEFAPGMFNTRRDPIEPEPVGTYVALIFKVTGYDKDCDGSLMARLQHVDKEGKPTGYEADCLGLYPDSEVVLERPSELHDLAHMAKLVEPMLTHLRKQPNLEDDDG